MSFFSNKIVFSTSILVCLYFLYVFFHAVCHRPVAVCFIADLFAMGRFIAGG